MDEKKVPDSLLYEKTANEILLLFREKGIGPDAVPVVLDLVTLKIPIFQMFGDEYLGDKGATKAGLK